MTKRKIQPGPIGSDVDLDKDEIYLADGRRLTERLAEEIAERALTRHRGRPSVSGGGRRTPSLTVRVPQPTETPSRNLPSPKARDSRISAAKPSTNTSPATPADPPRTSRSAD